MSGIELNSKIRIGHFCLDFELKTSGDGVTAIVGRSGAGKTSLLRWMAGLIRGESGYLKINGEIWEDSKKRIFLPAHERSVGYVFQENNLFPHLSVLKNLEYAVKRRPARILSEEFSGVTRKLGVDRMLAKSANELSGGERQRVALARSLLMKPKLLLLDEPLSALDTAAKAEIFPYLKVIKEESGIPIFFVTHSLSEIRDFADRVVEMKSGEANI